jgi:glycosyltransferase involved in cell wall biosynthesis
MNLPDTSKEHRTSRAPLASVVIPTYNREAFIEDAIHSVLVQSHPAIEILVVDDGSTDGTSRLLRRLQATHPKIQVLENRRRKGPSGARNSGILAAKGDYVAFLDSDDTWLPGHLSDGIRFLEMHPEIPLVFGNFRVEAYPGGQPSFHFFDEKNVLKRLHRVAVDDDFAILEGNLFEALIQENFFHVGTVIVRNALRGHVLFDEEIRFCEDRDFAIRIFKAANAPFAVRMEPTFVQRRHSGNLTHITDANALLESYEAFLHISTRYERELPLLPGEKKTLHGCVRSKWLRKAYRHRTRGELSEALGSVCQSVRYGFDPGQPTELLKILASAPAFLFAKRKRPAA